MRVVGHRRPTILGHVAQFGGKASSFNASICVLLKTVWCSFSCCTQSLVNVLLVPPESLIPLVDGSLRISHAQALKFVKLREDFKTARVGGAPLAALFSSD
jgi:hypothetical protein